MKKSKRVTKTSLPKAKTTPAQEKKLRKLAEADLKAVAGGIAEERICKC